MAQHGYLREGYGMWGDNDEREDRERERGWRDEDRERGLMFGESDRFRGDDSREWFGGRSRDEGRASFRSHPDDHYRSWRQKQIDALDRDYEDYCREREQQFHRDFDSWRSNRDAGRSSESLDLDRATVPSAETQGNPSPMADATMGTNTPENATTGRGRR
jgi:hypothetical protein